MSEPRWKAILWVHPNWPGADSIKIASYLVDSYVPEDYIPKDFRSIQSWLEKFWVIIDAKASSNSATDILILGAE